MPSALRSIVTFVVFACLFICAAPSSARAEVGATRVAVIDSHRLWSDAGIARWFAASARLESEKATFTVAEAPAGTRHDDATNATEAMTTYIATLPREQQERLKKELADIDNRSFKEQATRVAWNDHVHETLDPIEVDVMRKLAAYCDGHGIELLLAKSSLDEASAIMYIANKVDITDAFIKSYNAAADPPAHAKKAK